MPSVIGGKAAHDLYIDERIGEKLTQKALSWMNKQLSPFSSILPATTFIIRLRRIRIFTAKANAGYVWRLCGRARLVGR